MDFQSQDGGVITILSQNHPENYSDNYLVSYILEAPEGSYVFLAVSSLETEYRNDILFVGEGTEVGRRDTLRDTFTGNLDRKYATVESNTRWLWVMFVSDHKNNGAGYQFTVELVTPNIRLSQDESITIYSTTSLEFTSRQFSVARWRIEAPDDTLMQIRFLEFDLAVSLEIFVILDGLRPHNPEKYRFEIDGNQLPPDIVSLSNRMNIIFAAYSDTLNGTFVINVTARAVRPGDLAPTYVPAGEMVYLVSPNYPGLYPNYFLRIWVVGAPKGYIIRFRFLDLRMPDDNDIISFGDGFRIFSAGLVSFRGPHTSAPPTVYHSETNALYAYFSSDPTNRNGGFRIEISAITMPIVLDINDVHVLESPTYPMPYENSVFIEWNVGVPPDHGVLLRFISFGMNDQGDVLSVGRGIDSNDTNSVAGRFTGLLTPSDLVVWSDRVWIRFTTDSSGIGDGFELEIKAIQGEGYCLIPLGMESGWIPDNSLYATSQRDKAHNPSEARLHGPSSWIPDPDVDDSTIQVNFDQGHYITGILIQGGKESSGTWLESILVTFEEGGEEVIHRKWNPELVSLILFVRPRLSSHIRITPRSKISVLLSLRFEILGCQSGCHFDLGLASGKIALTNSHVPTGVSESDSNLDDLRLLPYEHRPTTGWGGRSSGLDSGVEVSLGTSTIVLDVIIQQCNDSRLRSFNLTSFSNESSFTFHFDISDCETAMCKVSLPESILATRFKILPTDWNNTLCFRIELFGCHRVDCLFSFCDENCSSAYLSPEEASAISMVRSGTFPPRTVCRQDITFPAGQYVVFIFSGFENVVDISGNPDGTLLINDTVAKKEITFDLRDVPSVFVTSSSNISVTILSGLVTGLSSVTAAFGSVDKPGCSNRVEGTVENSFSCKQSSGFVMSPGYFNSYPPDLDLSWDIATKPWTQISLYFVELDVKSLEEGCYEDYVTIMDVSSQKTLGRFCDQKKPSELVVSSLNRMKIRFHSDSIGSGSGFLVEYSSSLLIPDVITGKDTSTCPDGWDVFKGSCYSLYINSEALTWNEAELLCQDVHEGHLVSIRDQDEMIFLHYMISSQWESTETETYIGLGSRDDRGIFYWTDGTPMSYTDWYIPSLATLGERQPNGGLVEACTMLVFDSASSTDLSTTLWHDVACASPETKQFICETAATGPTEPPLELALTSSPKVSIINCGSGLFSCSSSGECVRKAFVCDGSSDCLDGTDEDNCPEGCASLQFQCSDGGCISVSFYCDAIPHCLDNSDESECALPLCREDEFECDSGQCIPASKRCDFIRHCYDSSDEGGCVLELASSAFQCYDGSLFPLKIQCDGIIDCVGNTNEDEYACAYSDPGHVCDLDTDILCSNGACAPQTTRCIYELDEFGFLIGCRDVTHLRDCGDFECPVWYLKCPSSYCIPLRYRCDEILDCPYGEDEAFCDKPGCPDGSYRCHGQRYCINLDHVCDGVIHCPEQDDELFCGECPTGCQCDGFTYSCHPELTNPYHFPRQLRKLSLICNELSDQCNSTLRVVPNDDVTQGTGNQLMPSLMPYMISLNLEASLLVEIRHGSFLENKNLLNLNLARNSICNLSQGTFDGLHRMKILNLSGNPLTNVDVGAFSNVTLLQELDLRGTTITVTQHTERGLFHGLENLKTLHADRYVFCCLAGLEDSVGCNAPHDQFSSCEELMANKVLRVFIWILGGSAFIGNAFVIVYRVLHRKREWKTIVQSSFITNLAVSDFMMGLYMITIASADIYYRGNYALHADDWQSSALCKMAGMVSVVSSEASVMFIMMISLDRCIHVVLPFKRGLHLSHRGARCSELIIWLIAILVSVLPVAIPAYDKGKFYGQSGVCLALPLTVDRPAGWHYSISLFIGANFVAFLITFLCYIAIYITYQRSKQMITKTGKGVKEEKRLSEEIKLAWKMSLIVGTDLICWFPIIIMGILSAAGKLEISAQVYAWTAVFVLPVNSSLNPYLYTLSSMRGKKKRSRNSAERTVTEEKSMESTFVDGDSTSVATAAPFTTPPLSVAYRLESWLRKESRDLTRQELEVIRLDVGQSQTSWGKACNTMEGCFKNIAIQLNDANRIQRAFVILDSPVTKSDPSVTKSDRPCSDEPIRADDNVSKVLKVLEEIQEAK